MRQEFRSPLTTDANEGRMPCWSPAVAPASVAPPLASSLAPGPGSRSAGGGQSRWSRSARNWKPTATACSPSACDVREPDQVDALLDAIGERTDGLDILVNNAGGQFAAPAEDIALKGFRAVHRLNVDAPWMLTHQVATRWMIPQRRGVIFFVGFSPRRGIPSMAHASTARSALETMAASLSNEWSRFGIRAICVAAGLIQTEGILQYGGQEAVDAFAREVPMKRPGSAEEVAATIAFLATAGGGYVTGSTVLVDGGADAWGMGCVARRPRIAEGYDFRRSPWS